MADVYAYGVIAPSTLLVLEDDYPNAGGYAEIEGVHHSIGGEAAGGAYVLARLGIDTSLDGSWLGDDDSSDRTIEILTSAGVDCSPIARSRTGAVTEVVLSAGSDRTVFGTYRKALADRAWNDPSEEAVRTSRVVCLDPFFPRSSLQAARWCRDAGTPYVTVDAAPGSEIAQHAEVLVVSEEYTTRELAITDPSGVLAAYTDQCTGLVIYTRGNRDLLYGRSHGPVGSFSPFAVEALDTTGAGDSFRAGVIYGILRGYADDQLVRTAAAVAALVCRRFPGVLHSPTEEELVAFLAGNT